MLNCKSFAAAFFILELHFGLKWKSWGVEIMGLGVWSENKLFIYTGIEV